MKKKILTTVVVTAIVLATLAGCSSGNDSLEGAWVDSDSSIELIISGDEFVINNNAAGVVIEGKYSMINDDEIKMVAEYENGIASPSEQIYSFSRKKDTITIDEVVQLTRQK